MKGGLGGLMKQAQQIQEKMQKAREELANTEVVGQSGGGMIRVHMKGSHEVRRVEIDPDAPLDDREMLEDLIAAAVNDANRKIESHIQEHFSGMAAGMGLPGGLKLPF